LSDALKADQWVWVMVQNPGGKEEFFGLHDSGEKASFIPVFLEKEIALQCFINLPRDPGKKYEAQAILYEDLAEQSSRNGFSLHLLDAEGRVIEKIRP
jgi:hypothetical protein